MSVDLDALFRQLELGSEFNQESFPNRPGAGCDTFVHDARHHLTCMTELVGSIARSLKETDRGKEIRREDIMTMRACALRLTVASMQMLALTNESIEGLSGIEAAQLAQYITRQYPLPKAKTVGGVRENAQ